MAIIRSRFDLAKSKGLSPEALARIDSLTPAEVEANALSDPDNPPLTDNEAERGLFARRVRLTREKLGLSQKDFAARFDINLRRLQDWEQGRVKPDSAILAYITVIEREPGVVMRILEHSTR
jgi:putative transcriptional regulator